jgi:glycerol-3-phosphate dehydrogenase
MREAAWQRDLDRLAATPFDLVVVGGGIYGAALAAEAAAAGLVTALVEARDFGHATSAASLRIMHGGLRYLQHLDLRRMRQSIAARREWLARYPELVRPMAFHVPTEGQGMRGPAVHRLAMALNDLLSFDANRGLDAADALPRSRMLDRAERARILDRLRLPRANGIACWHDGLMLDPERLLLAVLDEAVAAGAQITNHLSATALETARGKVGGVVVEDRLGGSSFVVRAGRVVDTTGPWSGGWTGSARAAGAFLPSRAFNLLTRKLDLPFAIGLPLPDAGGDQDDLFKKGAKTCFVVPWGNYSLIGTHHLPARDDGGRRVKPSEVMALVESVNSQLVGDRIGEGDVLRVFDGVLPANALGAVAVRKSPVVLDHAATGGPAGLVTVIGVKWTTARTVARAVLPLLGAAPARGEVRRTLVLERRRQEVARLAAERAEWQQPLPEGDGTTGGEVALAAREEMAMTLGDVVFRRTRLGLEARCGHATLAAAAGIMAGLHGWTPSRTAAEIAAVEGELARLALQAGRAAPMRAAAAAAMQTS